MKRLAMLILFFIPWTSIAAASTLPVQDSPGLSQSSKDALAIANASTPLEGAGSHGAMGVRIGSGASIQPVSADAVSEDGTVPGTQDGASPLVIPRLWLTKGLFYPVDLGITAGRATQDDLTLAGGYLQWTVFERLATPALALRGGFQRLDGGSEFTLDSTSANAVVSWGLAFVTVYGTMGVQRNELVQEDSKEVWNSRIQSAGVSVGIVPHFVNIAAEAQLGDATSYIAKLSVGM